VSDTRRWLRIGARAVGLAAVWGVVIGVGTLFVDGPSERGGLSTTERGEGEATFVLLHGYGAPGDDLVPLAEEVVAAVPGVRVVCPEGPVDVGLGGRAWARDPRQMEGSLEQLVAMVGALREERDGPLILGGFSQGAEVAWKLERRTGADGVVVLSGHLPDAPLDVPLFVAHGRSDAVIGFPGTERGVARLQDAGVDVTWIPHDGGHRTDPAVRRALARWLTTTLPRR